MRLPKNISKMTDEERGAWWMSLSEKDYESVRERTFKSTSYQFRIVDEHGDADGCGDFDTLAEAEIYLNRWTPSKDEVASCIHKAVANRQVVSGDMEDEDLTFIKGKGNFEALVEGGWN